MKNFRVRQIEDKWCVDMLHEEIHAPYKEIYKWYVTLEFKEDAEALAEILELVAGKASGRVVDELCKFFKDL